MTESEWMDCTERQPMLKFMKQGGVKSARCWASGPRPPDGQGSRRRDQ
jgi:hypothetical protein